MTYGLVEIFVSNPRICCTDFKYEIILLSILGPVALLDQVNKILLLQFKINILQAKLLFIVINVQILAEVVILLVFVHIIIAGIL